MKRSVLIVLLMLITSTFMQAQPNPAGYKIGDVVEDFTLKNIDENYFSLSNYKDKRGVILVFTCNHCPYSQAYEQRIINLNAEYEMKSYPVIAINPNDPEKEPLDSYVEMQKRAQEKNYPFPYLVDANGDIAMKFGATRTPHVFLLQNTPAGMKLVYMGAIDDNTEDASKAKNKYVEMAINDLESEKMPTVNTTKAIGCTIKWAKGGDTKAGDGKSKK